MGKDQRCILNPIPPPLNMHPIPIEAMKLNRA